MPGRPINQDRQNAIDCGLRTYTGAAHFRCGTTERYVAGGGCVQCARIIATEQREARKFLKQQAANHDADVELDNSLGALLDEDDAEARRQAAIDELM